MTVTSAITSTYEEKPPPEAPKNKANSKPIGKKAATAKLHQIRATRYEIPDTILRAYKAPLAGVPPVQAPRAHKTIPFMQNKANFQRAANKPNLSSNKHLRTQTTPGGPKKQSQSPKTPKSAQTKSAQRITEENPAGAAKKTRKDKKKPHKPSVSSPIKTTHPIFISITPCFAYNPTSRPTPQNG
jgi:hypothetical protein